MFKVGHNILGAQSGVNPITTFTMFFIFYDVARPWFSNRTIVTKKHIAAKQRIRHDTTDAAPVTYHMSPFVLVLT